MSITQTWKQTQSSVSGFVAQAVSISEHKTEICILLGMVRKERQRQSQPQTSTNSL